MEDFQILERNGEEIREELASLLDIWACQLNWKSYKKQYPLAVIAYYQYIQWPPSSELDPEDSNRKRNDFIYWEMKEVGACVSTLNQLLKGYISPDPQYRIGVIKKFEAETLKKESANSFLKEIKEEPVNSTRAASISTKLNEIKLGELIYYGLVLHSDFCRIYEYLNSRFDKSTPISPLVKVDKWSGTLPQAVLYHITLIKGEIEEEIDTNSIQKECGMLAERYGFKGYKRFSDYYNAISNNKKEVRGGSPFTYRDAEIVENALKQNFPDNPFLIPKLHKITKPHYP